MSLPRLTLTALEGLPEVVPGDDLAQLVLVALKAKGLSLQSGDLIAVCQKIVSKAENRYVELSSLEPGPRARKLAADCQRDPRLVELILREASAVVRATPQVLIVRHRLGFVVANAAIDQSNLDGQGERALLLPENPDRSAELLRARLQEALHLDLSVLITDSFGRPFRQGVCGVAIGAAGLNCLLDQRGQRDRAGRALQGTHVAIADQLAAAATLMMGEADEGRPLVIVSGLQGPWRQPQQAAAALVRPVEQDLFL